MKSKNFVKLTILLFFAYNQVLSQSIEEFLLVNSKTNETIRTISAGEQILLDKNISIVAVADNNTASVEFFVNGSSFSTENAAPFSLAGDINGDFNNWNVDPGDYTISADPYSGDNTSGTKGTSKSVTISLVDPETNDDSDNSNDQSGNGTGEIIVSGELKKWHKITLSFDGPFHNESDVSPNPFLDYQLSVTFTNGTEEIRVPGYFAADGSAAETSANSGNVWRVHFSPNKMGTWNYSVSFRKGNEVAVSLNDSDGVAVAPLDGMTGTISINDSDKSGRDFRSRGRLNYVGKHFLRFAESGEYFLKGGADSPENFLAYEDFDNTPNIGGRRKSWSPHEKDWNTGDPSWQNGKGTEIIGALNYLASEGLNAFSFLTMNINGDDENVYPYINDNNYLHFDCSKLAQWEIVFAHADEIGLYLHFKTQEQENDQLLDGGALGVERKLYYRELVARFSHHLALNWNLGEENTNTTSQIINFANYIKAIDPYNNHIVLHTFPNQQDSKYPPLLGNASELTGASIQIGWNKVYEETKLWVEESAAAGKKWVVANDEQGSANIGVPPDSYSGTPDKDNIRKQTLWGNLMAGGAGVEYYFGYSLSNSDLTAENFRTRDITWDYVRYALQFFRKYLPFQQMNPNQNLVNDGWCLAKEGEIYAVYLPFGGTTELDLNNYQGNYEIQWYNPRNGGNLLNGSKTILSGSGVQTIGYPPNNNDQDWVALITFQSSEENNDPGFLESLISSVDFGTVELGLSSTLDITFTNSGNESLEIQGFDFTGDSVHFSLVDNLPINIASQEQVILSFQFTPQQTGNLSSTINFTHTGSNSPYSIQLNGEGFEEMETSGDSIAINAGGGAIENTEFTSDDYFFGGKLYSVNNSIANTSIDELYQTERFDQNLNYSIPVNNGTYVVKLYFAEIYWTSKGQRIFDIFIEDNKVIDNFDIFRETGAFSALIKEYTVDITDSEISISMSAEVDNAKISGIEIIPESTINNNNPPVIDITSQFEFSVDESSEVVFTVSDPDNDITGVSGENLPAFVSLSYSNGSSTLLFEPQADDAGEYTSTITASDEAGNTASETIQITINDVSEPVVTSVIRINTGDNVAVTYNDITFEKDQYFNNWNVYVNPSQISNTEIPELYQTERFGGLPGDPLTYSIPVQQGSYRVKLHFAEIYWESENQRVFDVFIEGTQVLNNFDIFKEAGSKTALIKTFDVENNDNELISIEFIASIDYAKISAIEIESIDNATNARKMSKTRELPFAQTISVYPNPIEDVVNLNVSGLADNEQLKLDFKDILGNTIFYKVVNKIDRNHIKVDLHKYNLNKGMYIFSIDDGSQNYSFKLIKQ